MKLGILNACTPGEEEEFEAQEFANFQAFFDLTEHDFELTEYRITEGEFPEVGDCEAYLISGSPKGVYDDEAWITQLAEFIRQSHARQAKLVGICFGHQILAHALGGYAEKSEKGWGLGLQPLQLKRAQPWMNPPLPQGVFYFCHQDQVTRLPDEAELLAGSEFCPNGLFVIGDQVLGLQAHPEFSHEVMEKTITWLREKTAANNVDEAAATLNNGPADNRVMARWIVNFLNKK